MANKKDQLKTGISAMFGETQPELPPAQVISDDQYEEMERRQSERRFFMTGRRRNGDDRELLTKNDVRTCMLLDKDQYDKIREIALRETMTIKDVVHAMFQLGIDRYEEKHGRVVVRPVAEKKDIFWKPHDLRKNTTLRIGNPWAFVHEFPIIWF